jgi:hypothetical protein
LKTRPKDLGTALETFVVRAAQAVGLLAERLPEGGSRDKGDVRIYTDHEWVGEIKNRQQLNIHKELEAATRKSETVHTFVVWKRMARREGSQRRHQVGPTIVAITLTEFLDLLYKSTNIGDQP